MNAATVSLLSTNTFVSCLYRYADEAIGAEEDPLLAGNVETIKQGWEMPFKYPCLCLHYLYEI